MNFVDGILLLVIAAIVFAAVRYICREKKRGAKCIGCPHGAACKSCSGDCKSCKTK